MISCADKSDTPRSSNVLGILKNRHNKNRNILPLGFVDVG